MISTRNGLMILLFLLTIFSASFVKQRTASVPLQLDFYADSCPRAERIIFSQMRKILQKPEFKNAPAQLLRLFFHDCFIEGCDASVLLEQGDPDPEKEAVPNSTLKGFQFIDMIKEELEKECPGIVSCSDILVLATRDSISLTGGPYYPVYTGRIDSKQSFHDKATKEIPSPFATISEVLRLFALRSFNARETVALLGAHNIGIISCQFIKPRVNSSIPDPYISPDFEAEINQRCDANKNNNFSVSEMSTASSPPKHNPFGTQYFNTLLIRRGLLFSDMELMSHEKTAEVVEEFSSDDGESFRREFTLALIKMSNLVPLTGTQGEVRTNCSATRD